MPEAATTPEVMQAQGLRVLRWKGQGGGVPLVLLHGMGDGADVWRATVAALRHWHPGDILAPTCRGTGVRPGRATGITGWARWPRRFPER